MFFFFGVGTSTLGGHRLSGVRCTYCSTPDAVTVVVFSRYFHVFWIPFFPFGKRAVSVCAHCKQTLAEGDWPVDYRTFGAELRHKARYPLTNFIGLIILGVVLLLIAVAALIGNR